MSISRLLSFAPLLLLSCSAPAEPAAAPVASGSGGPAASASGAGQNSSQKGAGRLPPEVIQKTVRGHFTDLKKCYEAGLAKKPALSGRVTVSFVIGTDGKVTSASDGGSDLPDPEVVACVLKHFQTLAFPAPEGGVVTVTYPIQFSPKDE